MKTISKIFFILFLINIICNSALAQSSTIAKLIITRAYNNGTDITNDIIEQGAFTAFFTTSDDNRIYMANVWPKNESQSHGPIFNSKNDYHSEIHENYKIDFVNFKWYYINSYDSERGVAKVLLVLINSSYGTSFIIKIIPENLEVIIYKGYMIRKSVFTDNK